MTNAGSCSAAVSIARPQPAIAPESWNARSSTSIVHSPSGWQPCRSARSPCGRKRPANGGTASAIATGAAASKTVVAEQVGAAAAAAREHDARAVGPRTLSARSPLHSWSRSRLTVSARDRPVADTADGDRRGRHGGRPGGDRDSVAAGELVTHARQSSRAPAAIAPGRGAPVGAQIARLTMQIPATAAITRRHRSRADGANARRRAVDRRRTGRRRRDGLDALRPLGWRRWTTTGAGAC